MLTGIETSAAVAVMMVRWPIMMTSIVQTWSPSKQSAS
jgi:hypothetical protein